MTKSMENPVAFLRRFFGDGNALTWADYESREPNDPLRSALQPWVARCEKQTSPFLLPRVDPESNHTSWYVLCNGPREARSMQESLQAFVGPTYATFNGELAALNESDPIDHLCAEHFGSLVFRLPVIRTSDRKTVADLLTMLVTFRDRYRDRTMRAIKPIGRLLRDLEMALLVRNEDSARQIYTEIRSRGRLSATNLAFLDVHILAAFDHWEDILSLPHLNDLMQIRRPKRATEQIATAVYRQLVLKYEEPRDSASAIEALRKLNGRYQSLVHSTDGFKSRDAIKLAVVSAAAVDPSDRRAIERLVTNVVHELDRPWCQALLKTISPTNPATLVSEAVTHFDEADTRYSIGDFDEAFTLYLSHPASFRSLCRVLEIAVEIDTISAAQRAIDYFNNAADDVRGKVLGRRNCTRQIESLTSILGQDHAGEGETITSWEAWFDFVDHSRNLDNASQILEHGSREWGADESGKTIIDSVRIGTLLRQSRSGRPRDVVRNAVPIMIRVFLPEDSARRECKPVYLALIELLIYDEAIGTDDLAAVERLVEAVLTTAPTHEIESNDFAFAADITQHLWSLAGSPRQLDWALSMLDLLIDTGTQQYANLTPVLASIVESVATWPRRVRDDQWTLLELLATDLRLSEMVTGLRPEPETDDRAAEATLRTRLRGKSIAVYSLTERIARRFGQMAEQAFDGIALHFVHDRSLTDRMKSLARSADIFIVNTWDAKHAATNGIKDNRSRNAVTLEPEGKAPSSLMRCLQQFAATLT